MDDTMHTHMLLPRRTCLLLALLCSAALSTPGCNPPSVETRTDPKQLLPDAFYTGTDSCIPCHDDVHMQYKKTVHYRLSSFELSGTVRGCESCHGPGSIHVKEKGGRDNIVSFKALSAEESSAICLECHRGNPVMDWASNTHITNGVGCNECHKSHKVTAPDMVHLGDPEICFTCHQDKKAQHLLPSHHPVREKKLQCSSCHNNHGSENNNLRMVSLNDLCLDCHMEYQGPFVYEHAPAAEDCSICHDPHGTIANNLLKQNEPFLCLRCHRGHRQNPATGPHPSNGVFLTSCTHCHSQVHGSDLPSQLDGKGLTR